MPKRKSAVRDELEGDLTRIVTAKWFGYNPAAKAMLFAMVVGEMMLSSASKPRQVKHVHVEYAGSGALCRMYDIGPDTTLCDVLDRVVGKTKTMDYELRVGHNGPVVKRLWDSISNGATLVVARRCFKGTVVAMPGAFFDSLNVTFYSSINWHPSGTKFVVTRRDDIRFWNLVTNSWEPGFNLGSATNSLSITTKWTSQQTCCDRPDIHYVEYSPNGIHIAVQWIQNTVYVLNTLTKRVYCITEGRAFGDRSQMMVWSPNGVYLAVVDLSRLDAELDEMDEEEEGVVYTAESISIWDSCTNKTTTITINDIIGDNIYVDLDADMLEYGCVFRSDVHRLDWNPTQTQLAALVKPHFNGAIPGDIGTSVITLDTTTFPPQFQHRMNIGNAIDKALKEVNTTYAAAGEEGWFSVYDLHYHPDGKQLLVGVVVHDEDHTQVTTYGCILVPETNTCSLVQVLGPTQMLTEHENAPRLLSARWNPDGIRFVITTGSRLIVWNLDTNQPEPIQLPHLSPNPMSARWNPAGTCLGVCTSFMGTCFADTWTSSTMPILFE